MALKLKNPALSQLTKTPQRKTYTVVGVTLVVVIMLLFFAVRPAISSVFNQINSNKDRRQVLAQMDQKYNNLLSLNTQETSQSDDLKYLDEIVPTDRDEEFVKANIEGIVDENGLNLEFIGFNDNTDLSVIKLNQTSPKAKSAIVTFSVTGTRAQVFSLMSDIEDFPRPINLLDVSVRSIDQKSVGSSVQVVADVKAEIYYYEE